MKLNQVFGFLLAAGLLTSGRPAGAAVYSSFTGDLAPGNWTETPVSSNPGSYAFSSDNTSLQLFASANSAPTDFILEANVSQGFSMNISWTLNNNGNSSGNALAYYYLGNTAGTPHALAVGSSSVSISGSQSIAFELSSSGTRAGKSPAELEISFTDFVPVPEPGVWPIAGGVLLGCVYLGFALVRQARLRSVRLARVVAGS